MFVIYVAEGANMDIVVSSCQCYCVPIRISRHPVPYSNTTTLHIKALRNVTNAITTSDCRTAWRNASLATLVVRLCV